MQQNITKQLVNWDKNYVPSISCGIKACALNFRPSVSSIIVSTDYFADMVYIRFILKIRVSFP